MDDLVIERVDDMMVEHRPLVWSEIIFNNRLWWCLGFAAILWMIPKWLPSALPRRGKYRRNIDRILIWIEIVLPDRIHLYIVPIIYFLNGGFWPMFALFMMYYGLGVLYHFILGTVYPAPWNEITKYPTYALGVILLLHRVSSLVGWVTIFVAAGLLGLQKIPDLKLCSRYSRISKCICFPMRLLVGFSRYFWLACQLLFEALFPLKDSSTRNYNENGNVNNNTASDDGRNSSSDKRLKGNLEALSPPKGSTEIVAGILKSTTHYQVLNIREDASEEDIRKAKRMLSLQTHPDKSGQSPGTSIAFQRVLEASEILMDEQSRLQYDLSLETLRFSGFGLDACDQEAITQIYEETGVDVEKLKSSIIFGCPYCQGSGPGVHQFFLVPDRAPSSARYCTECRKRHAVRKGEMWVEEQTTWVGGLLPRKELCLLLCETQQEDGTLLRIWDATSLGKCSGILETYITQGLPLDMHRNPLQKAMKGGAKGSSDVHNEQNTASHSRKKGKKGRRR